MNAVLKAITTHAAVNSDSIALEGDSVRLSYAALHDEVAVLATRFERLGCRSVGLLLDNGPAWVVCDLAAQAAAVTLVPIPGFFSSDQARHTLRDAGVEFIVAEQPAQIASYAPEAIFCPLGCIAGQNTWLARFPEAVPRDDLPSIAKLTYTSGTTGTPKGVCLTQPVMERVAVELCDAIDVTPQDRHLCLLPLAVLLENIAGVYTSLLAGARCIVPGLAQVGALGAAQLDARRMLAAISTHQASSVILLPQMLHALVSLIEGGLPRPTSLRFIAVGGAPVSRRLLERAQVLGLPVFEGYGLSECASVVAVNTPHAQRLGSVGKVLPHVRIQFTDEGEILFAGNLYSGYLHDKDQHEAWYGSGDLGYLDADGYLHLTGRKKNIFITSFGRNVAPEWVEKELTFSPHIAQAVVFGEARPYNVAVIVPRPEHDPSVLARVAAAIAQANSALPDYARVSSWIVADEPLSVDNQQVTATGRPRRGAVWAAYGERINQLYEHNGDTTERRPHVVL